ncbi:MAG: HIT family protein, partial [Lentisphaeria bacterium]|nr:HIT family protein [Lentisphaeria bacterium]
GRMVLVGSRIGVAMRRGLNADGFNLHLSDGTVAGQVVMHAHLHIVPRWTDDGFHWNWRQLQYESEAQRAEIQEMIKGKFQLKRDDEELALNEEITEGGERHD